MKWSTIDRWPTHPLLIQVSQQFLAAPVTPASGVVGQALVPDCIPGMLLNLTMLLLKSCAGDLKKVFAS